MKKITFLIISLITLVVLSCKTGNDQMHGFKIKVNTELDFQDTLILTRYSLSDNKYHDTLLITNLEDGKAVLKGELDEPCVATLRFKKAKKRVNFILDNSIIRINVRANNMLEASMKGTEILSPGLHGKILDPVMADEAYSEALLRFLTFATEVKDLRSNGADEITISNRRRLSDKAWFDIIKTQRKVLEEIVDTTQDPRIKILIQIYDNFYKDVNKEALLVEYQQVYGKDYNYLLFKKRLDIRERNTMLSKRFAVGGNYVDFVINDMNEQTYKVSDIVAKNKFVLLEFWASWCSPCRAEIPNLKDAYNAYHSKGFEIFAVSMDKSRSAWLNASQNEEIPYINTSNLQGLKSELGREYGLDTKGVPLNYLINKDGIIVAKDIKGKDLLKKLSEFLD